jgi:hypothetical protein
MNLELEEQLAKELFATASSVEIARTVICFPENLTGLRTLDIGAGASSCTAWLCAQGAESYALDARYDDPEKLAESLKSAMRALHSEYMKKHNKTRWPLYEQKMRASQRLFQEHRSQMPDRYVSGYASKLPFPNASFDLVYSINCITHGLDIDYDIFSAAVYEALRVGRELRMHPFLGNVSQKQLGHHAQLLAQIKVNYDCHLIIQKEIDSVTLCVKNR